MQILVPECFILWSIKSLLLIHLALRRFAAQTEWRERSQFESNIFWRRHAQLQAARDVSLE